MNVAPLLPFVARLPGYRELLARLKNGASGEPARSVVLEEAKAPLVAALARDRSVPVLLTTTRVGRAGALVEQLRAWAGPDLAVLALPEPDVLPYERLNPDDGIVQERLSTFHRLSRWQQDGGPPTVIVASVGALTARTIAPSAFAAAALTITQGDRIRWDELGARLLQLGYQPVSAVEAPGQFARRGGVIDIYSAQLDAPFRLDLFGDVIDSIRAFDVATQRSTNLLQSAEIIPAREVLGPPWEQAPELPDLSGCSAETRATITEELHQLLQGGEVKAPWFYAPLFNHASALEYLPRGGLLVWDEPRELAKMLDDLHAQGGELRRELSEKGELPAGFPDAHLNWEELERRSEATPQLALYRWGGEGDEELGVTPAPGYGGRLKPLLAEVRRGARTGAATVIVSLQSERLAELLEGEEVYVRPTDELSPEAAAPGSVALVHGSLPGGWAVPLAENGDEDGPQLTLLTDVEIFGFVKEERRRLIRRRKRREENPLLGISPGDYVVHVEHGIARLAGVITMEEQPGVGKEYLHLQYAGGSRLYVPMEQVDRVSRYIGPGGHVPALSTLGTQEWERAKERVRKAAVESAREMLATMAAREVMSGIAFSPDTPWQQELEASFPYVETVDQLRAVREVKADMEQPQPMDRLVCGDVGYGKTEVAVRAAFKAVQDGMQVGILVPTTVLAQQHEQTFSQRLKAFPIKVEVLSRFRNEREQGEVLEGLRSGSVDMVIGTHRLLQRDVEFKNLGLVIVDEEQRFGVLHKEFFKRLRQEVDVLTLSATPIPRTLYMALVGVRDMSVMETPPEERLPIKTYVMEFDDAMVRHAIQRELERGGQVFFVHNRVQNIAHIAKRLADLVPEARIAVGHGQMHEEALERVMLEFSQGEYDVLLCTTIIESGLDLPNVNTIIINDADKLGLAQLYQLRGRVGRGSSRAYAYLLYTRNKALTERAQQRLQAVFEATDLGAGYFIAMKDLEIRGAGNLLGTEQSGHIGAVGFDLYTRILASAVEDAKAESHGMPAPSSLPQLPPVSLDLQLAAYLPDDYVPALEDRLDLYRRLAVAAEPDEVEELAQELHDRFGPSPPAARNLVFVVHMKLLALRAGAAQVVWEGEEIVIRLQAGLYVNRRPLLDVAGVRPGNTQVRVDGRGGPERWRPRLAEALRRMSG